MSGDRARSAEEWSGSSAATQSDFSESSEEDGDCRPQSSTAGSVLMSSFEVFMSFVADADDEDDVRVERVFSEDCFKRWLETRTKAPKEPQESFRRALTSHVRGTDQRKPFPEDVERALLCILRQKRSWDCFEKLGRYGFRGKGFHENRRKKERKRRKKLRKRAREMYEHPLQDFATEHSEIMSFTSAYGYHHTTKRLRHHPGPLLVGPTYSILNRRFPARYYSADRTPGTLPAIPWTARAPAHAPAPPPQVCGYYASPYPQSHW